MELAVDQSNIEKYPAETSKSAASKSSKKRKWREIEAILDKRNLYKELEEIDEFGQFSGLSENAA